MARWNETLHPRDHRGQFTHGGGGRTEQLLHRSKSVRVTASVPAARAYRPGTDRTDWVNTHVDDLFEADAAGGPGDHMLTGITRAQGWGTPTVGTRADVDTAVASGWTEVHRGVQPHKGTSATEILDDSRHNPDHALGTGIYGNGIYTSVRREVAEEFGKGNGATVRMALNPDARTVDYDDLVAEMDEWRAAEVSSGRLMGQAEFFESGFQVPPGRTHPETVGGIGADPGRFAAMRGYDAIRVVGKKDGGRARPGARLNTSTADQYVVLNRTMMLIEDTP